MLLISTCRFYHVHFAYHRCWYMIIEPDAYSMLQVLAHDDCTICTVACYGIGTIIFLIVTVNMEYHIIVLIARDFVFQTSVVAAWIWFLLVSAELFAVWVSIRVNISLEVVGFTICRPLQLSDCSCIFVLSWDPHTCQRGYNRYL